jgi:hypothetical protein
MTDPNADAPLPPGWSRGYSKSQQRTFYFHAETKHTQWHFPTASEAKNPLKAKERAEANKASTPHATTATTKSRNNNYNNNHHDTKRFADTSNTASAKRSRVDDAAAAWADATSVAIIVPYRDLHTTQHRAQHLAQFIPHMHQFFRKLHQQGLVSSYHVYIVEQSNDERKFNRGKLLNIGFDLARKSRRGHDVFIFHDVDLLPQDDIGKWYAQFPKRPLHIARVWKRYSNNPNYFGGVVSFSSSDYKRINGYPNTFWGWGGEDDEMKKRLDRLGITFDSPDKGTLLDLEQMTLDEKLSFLKKNREWKCMVKWEALDEHEKTWKSNGLADLKYHVENTQFLDDTQNASKITVDVKLNGNHWANDKCGLHYLP